MVKDRRTCNPQIYLLDVEWGNFTVSCVVKPVSFPLCHFLHLVFPSTTSTIIPLFFHSDSVLPLCSITAKSCSRYSSELYKRKSLFCPKTDSHFLVLVIKKQLFAVL